MTEKRYTYSELNNCQYSVSYTTFEEIYGEENIFHSRICEVNNKKQAQKVVDLLNEQEETIQELKTEVLDLQAEVGRLNSKKEIEKPHWLKYESSKGYTRQVNQDIRFKGDVE